MMVMVKVMATCDYDQVLNMEKKKEKNKNHRNQGKGITRVFILVIKTL